MNNFVAFFARRRLVFLRILLSLALLASLTPYNSFTARAEDTTPSAPAAPVSASEAIQAAAPVTGTHPVATLGCKFSGNASEPKPLSYFGGLMVSNTPADPTFPSVDNYFRTASYQQMTLAGSQSFGWFTLPGSIVAGNVSTRALRKSMAQACITAAEASVNFNNFKIINIVVNASVVESIESSYGSRETLTLEGVSREIPLAIFSPAQSAPVDSTFQQAVVVQKMLWALRSKLDAPLDFLSMDVNGGLNNIWDGVTQPLYNCAAQTDPTYGCIAQQPTIFHKEGLGWIPVDRIWSPKPDVMTQTVTLVGHGDGLLTGSLPRMVLIPINYSATNYYLLEVRRNDAINRYDQKLAPLLTAPDNVGLIIHRVTLSSSSPTRLQKADAVASTTPENAYLNDVAGRNKFTGEAGSGIVIDVMSRSLTSFTLRIKIPTNQVSFIQPWSLDDDGVGGFVNAPGDSVWLSYDVTEANWYAVDIRRAVGSTPSLESSGVTLFGPNGLRPVASGSGPRNGKLNEIRPVWITPGKYYVRIFVPVGGSPQTGGFNVRMNRPLTVRSSNDDALLHSLSYAADMVLPGQKITFLPGINQVTTSRTITLTAGVALQGTTTCNAAEIVTIDGTGAPAGTVGLLLQGDNQVTGMRVKKFPNVQIKTTGRNNDLSCVRASKN